MLSAVVLDEIGPHVSRGEESLELDPREFPDLGLRVVLAALLFYAGADLLHDLLDIDRF